MSKAKIKRHTISLDASKLLGKNLKGRKMTSGKPTMTGNKPFKVR